MKPTLNEEIEMSKQGIDYVNSIEPVEHQSVKTNEIGLSWEIAERAMKNNIPELVAKIKRQLIIKFIAVQIFLAGYLYLIVSIIGGSIYYNEWNNIANLLFIPLEIGYLIQFCKMLNKYIL